MKRKKESRSIRKDPAYLIGRRIAALRKALGMNQADLATKAGVNLKYLGELENGRRDIRLATLIRLAKALGVKPGDLFRVEEEDQTMVEIERRLHGRDQAFRGHVLRVVNEILMIADSAG